MQGAPLADSLAAAAADSVLNEADSLVEPDTSLI